MKQTQTQTFRQPRTEKNHNNLKLEVISGGKTKEKSVKPETECNSRAINEQLQKVNTKRAYRSLFLVSAVGRLSRDTTVKTHYYQHGKCPFFWGQEDFFFHIFLNVNFLDPLNTVTFKQKKKDLKNKSNVESFITEVRPFRFLFAFDSIKSFHLLPFTYFIKLGGAHKQQKKTVITQE